MIKILFTFFLLPLKFLGNYFYDMNIIGTGKSQFLKFAAKLSNRSVITTGLGSTSAGLTVTAVKDGGTFQLKPYL